MPAAQHQCLCPDSGMRSDSYLLLQLLAEAVRLTDEPFALCRPAPIWTWFSFNCTLWIGILIVWGAKSFGTVTRPNPSLLAVWLLMAFPHFTWDRALKCFLQTWPTPSGVWWGLLSHWYFPCSKWTPHLDLFITLCLLQQRDRRGKVPHVHSGSPCRGLAPGAAMSTCRLNAIPQLLLRARQCALCWSPKSSEKQLVKVESENQS